MQIVGKAVFAIEADETGVLYQATVVTHENKLWLVATWISPPAPAEPVPEWLLPLDSIGLGHLKPAPLMTLGNAVPKALAGPDAELQAMQRAGAVLNPLLSGTQAHGRIQ